MSDQAGLREVLLEPLDRSELSEEQQLIVWAAIEGDEELNDYLADPDATRNVMQKEATASVAPPRAYLDKISVQGFRGIGPEATLRLSPGPRLILVVGRNGSGKSSFAEAMEIALTGSNARWAGKSEVWRDGWRNLHNGASAMVELSLHLEGDRGHTVVQRSWPGDDVTKSDCWVQRPRERRAGLESFGWESALKAHRPFLSYAELGQMISGKPSEAYDALESILGLDRLAAAEKRLRNVQKSLKDQVKQTETALNALLDDLRECNDPRAEEAVQALSGRKKDLDGARALALGSQTEDPALAGLRQMSRLVSPSKASLDAAANDLRHAVDELAKIRGTGADEARRLADLLQRAVDHYQRHQDQGACFVCGTPDVLTVEWAERTRTEIGRLQAEAARAENAHQAVRQRLAAARQMITPIPDGLPVGTPVHAAWRQWAAGAEINDPGDLAEHIASAGPALVEACDSAIAEANRKLNEFEDLWRPFRSRLALWLEQRRIVDAASGRRTDVKAAADWLKVEGAELRNIRLAPLAHKAQQVWQDLRQQSNVSLGEIRLTGSATRRAVDYAVEVDGVPGPALGVMSQGELHSLALSIFLPRASLPESPFGFLLIDDPVQSMDPAKVDGLARVLHRYAQDRQVIVFTHDTRLSEAVRRLRLETTILEVVRRERSVVECAPLRTPWCRRWRTPGPWPVHPIYHSTWPRLLCPVCVVRRWRPRSPRPHGVDDSKTARTMHRSRTRSTKPLASTYSPRWLFTDRCRGKTTM
jgi:DNA repair exonuclease SbcCD ATPase subunit